MCRGSRFDFRSSWERIRENLLSFSLDTGCQGLLHAWKAQSQTVPWVKKQIPTRCLGSGRRSSSPSSGGCFLVGNALLPQKGVGRRQAEPDRQTNKTKAKPNQILENHLGSKLPKCNSFLFVFFFLCIHFN